MFKSDINCAKVCKEQKCVGFQPGMDCNIAPETCTTAPSVPTSTKPHPTATITNPHHTDHGTLDDVDDGTHGPKVIGTPAKEPPSTPINLKPPTTTKPYDRGYDDSALKAVIADAARSKRKRNVAIGVASVIGLVAFGLILYKVGKK
jgi:hypothetical protein